MSDLYEYGFPLHTFEETLGFRSICLLPAGCKSPQERLRPGGSIHFSLPQLAAEVSSWHFATCTVLPTTYSTVRYTTNWHRPVAVAAPVLARRVFTVADSALGDAAASSTQCSVHRTSFQAARQSSAGPLPQNGENRRRVSVESIHLFTSVLTRRSLRRQARQYRVSSMPHPCC